MEHESAMSMTNVICLITESDPGNAYYDMLDCSTTEHVKSWFYDNGLTWGEIVEIDTERIINELEPMYFLSDFDYAEVYRSCAGIYLKKPRAEVVKGESTFALLEKHMENLDKQREKFGVTLWQYGHGYACFSEANYFYKTQIWQRKARVVRYMCRNTCSICKVRGVPLHAHHNTPIVSAYHYNFHLNFADYKLEALCEKCHQNFHANTVRSAGHYGFHFVTDMSEIKEEKDELRLLKKAHDELKICPHCFNYRPGWDEVYMNWPDVDYKALIERYREPEYQ